MGNMTKKRGSVSIGLIQGKDFGSKQANLEFTLEQIKALANQGAQIICTQELFNTSYFCSEQNTRNFDLAESIPGETSEIFSRLAKELGGRSVSKLRLISNFSATGIKSII